MCGRQKAWKTTLLSGPALVDSDESRTYHGTRRKPSPGNHAMTPHPPIPPISPNPPPSPAKPRPFRGAYRVLIAGGVVVVILVSILVSLRLLGLLIPWYIPTASMAPTLASGDHVFTEGFTYLKRAPQRGDVVVFSTQGIDKLQPGALHTKRIAGAPGEHLQIADGHLYINDKQVAVSNLLREIAYPLPPGPFQV